MKTQQEDTSKHYSYPEEVLNYIRALMPKEFCEVLRKKLLQVRKSRRCWGASDPQIFATVDLLPIYNVSEKKKKYSRKYKPFQVPPIYCQHYSCPLHVMHKTNFDRHYF